MKDLEIEDIVIFSILISILAEVIHELACIQGCIEKSPLCLLSIYPSVFSLQKLYSPSTSSL